MKPLIGITSNIMNTYASGFDPKMAALFPEAIYAPRDYPTAVEQAGGIPVLLPVTTDPATMAAMLDKIDAILFTGGEDIDPQEYGETYHLRIGPTSPDRDTFDLTLARMALERDMPILGICRGNQIINVAAGGTLYQDTTAQIKDALFHPVIGITPKWHPTHEVVFEPGSKIAKIYGTERLWTNGYHHQAVKDAGQGIKITGRTLDGAVEAVESEKHTFVVGVQWHPEMMLERHPEVLPLFKALVEAATGKHNK